MESQRTSSLQARGSPALSMLLLGAAPMAFWMMRETMLRTKRRGSLFHSVCTDSVSLSSSRRPPVPLPFEGATYISHGSKPVPSNKVRSRDLC